MIPNHSGLDIQKNLMVQCFKRNPNPKFENNIFYGSNPPFYDNENLDSNTTGRLKNPDCSKMVYFNCKHIHLIKQHKKPGVLL